MSCQINFKYTDQLFPMRFPIKFNRAHLLSILKILPSQYDPRKLLWENVILDQFESSISAIKADNTWKTTKKNRHVITDQLIKKLLYEYNNSIILEVGASSGIASLDLLNLISTNITRYYITDLSFTLQYRIIDDKTFFYHPISKKCIMCVTNRWIFYNDSAFSIFPFDFIIRNIFTKAPPYDPASLAYLSLVHPTISQIAREDSRIIVKEFNIFEKWGLERVDILIVANLLNLAYFNEKLILQAICNFKSVLKIGGSLVIAENRKKEKVSIFKLTEQGTFALVENVNTGCQIELIVANSNTIIQ